MRTRLLAVTTFAAFACLVAAPTSLSSTSASERCYAGTGTQAATNCGRVTATMSIDNANCQYSGPNEHGIWTAWCPTAITVTATGFGWVTPGGVTSQLSYSGMCNGYETLEASWNVGGGSDSHTCENGGYPYPDRCLTWTTGRIPVVFTGPAGDAKLSPGTFYIQASALLQPSEHIVCP